MTASEASALATRKARYGHRDWLVWKDKSGEYHAAQRTADSLKAAMLATGTQGRFFLYAASNAVGHIVWWWLANNMRRQALRGY